MSTILTKHDDGRFSGSEQPKTRKKPGVGRGSRPFNFMSDSVSSNSYNQRRVVALAALAKATAINADRRWNSQDQTSRGVGNCCSLVRPLDSVHNRTGFEARDVGGQLEIRVARVALGVEDVHRVAR